MREIVFKGKRLDNGECIIGNLVVTEDAEEGWETIIIPTFDSNIFTKGVAKGDLGFENWHRVDKNTICQYTGLTDKNGNKIWENDIVMLDDEYWVVEWSDADAMFVIECEFCVESFSNVWNKDCEVYGNSFDNPELLKGGAE